ncbi:S1 family peptidase, partial ['Camptotheca acuminata' phytoplasma]|uniref:S1 family peptidase n=1 Tax='Camptotheca acuminata' phytoplasma TaxID=3239192 RepID=UPI00351A5FDA
EEEEPKKEKINNSKLKKIEQMTFLISSHNSLGSGFIFGIEEHTECKTNHFQYYVLTNRHVIDSKNQINYCAKIYNYFFGLKKAKIIGFIKNEDVYDDIAVLSFCDDIPDKYNTIKQNKKEIYPETEIYTFQGETIYSMGSQVSKMENLRVSFSSQSNPNPNTNINNIFQDNDKLNSNIELSLLKKGNIVSKHDKEISFDIQIDHGNSGGPVFNKNGEIIGMNKSTIIANDVPDNTSQSINIEHIKKIYNRIMCLHKKEPNKQYFKISPEDNYKFAKEEIESFELFSSKPSNKKRSINISIEELIDYLSCSETKKINSKKITKSDSNNEMKFIMESINIFSDKDTIFSIDPTKEEIEISFDPGKEQIVLSKYHNNKQIIKQIDDKKLNNKQFFSFKLIDKLNPNPKESNEHAKKLQKIKNSLIVWNQNKNKSGNGIIFYREKISNNNYLYFVLSTYNIDKEKLEHITEPIKNIFDNEVEITNFYNENSKKEKGEIKTFYFENKNLALITFESSHKYDTVKIRPIKDLVLGEEIFSLINTDKDDYIPQMFKSNVGYKDKDYNYILCDSVFNLKSKKINSGSPLSLLYFDSESNFIGTNDILDKDKDQVPDYFNKISFLKEENFKMLLYKNKFKDNFNLLFSVFFIIVMFWIFIFKIDIKAIF